MPVVLPKWEACVGGSLSGTNTRKKQEALSEKKSIKDYVSDSSGIVLE
jgi:hypothetical protein